MENEIWKDIPGYEGFYEASNLGRIKSIARISYFGSKKRPLKEKILKQRQRFGYMQVSLSKFGENKYYQVHRLIAFSFINNIENKPYINHINGIKNDNKINNLEWVTSSENSIHAFKLGLRTCLTKGKFGKLNAKSKQICQYDLNGKYLNTFESMHEAQRLTGINHRCISNVCIGNNKTAGNYIWKFS